ncbi:MAG TPA: CRISPR-associated protein Cas4 [Longilinea sp.]|nr:CRISPR-associated protein Cas4 [Longilinea sp.]
MNTTLIGVFLLLLAVVVLYVANRQRSQIGLPPGRVVYSDPSVWGKVERVLYDPSLGLAGKPDYLVQQNGNLIPVEVKSGFAPAKPHDSHIYQLAAYCYLVEQTYGKKPAYGLINYRNRTFAIDYTPQLEQNLKDIINEMRWCEKHTPPGRSHQEPVRCARCGFRDNCTEKI